MSDDNLTIPQLSDLRASIAECPCNHGEHTCDAYGCGTVEPLLDEIERITEINHNNLKLISALGVRCSSLRTEVERLRVIEERAKQQMEHYKGLGDAECDSAHETARFILTGGE